MSGDTTMTSESCDDKVGVTLPEDPFTSVNYVFGMLLGVEELKAEQGYHRGKGWLHNAWLHGAGVVWGLDVTLSPASGASSELRVSPGLGLDAAGRELHLTEPQCVVLADWYAKHRDDAGMTRRAPTSSQEQVDLHVVAVFRACLGRDIPAIMEPCRGSAADVAPSRAYELLRLDLRPGKAPSSPPTDTPRLCLLFGLREALTTPAEMKLRDDDVLARRAAVLTAPPRERGARLMEAFRACAALDVRDLRSANGAFTPVGDEAELLLANARDVTFAKSGSVTAPTWTLVSARVDTSVAPAHVATRAMQDLVCGLFSACVGAPTGPRFGAHTLSGDRKTLAWTTTAPLAAASAGVDAVRVSTLDDAHGWTEVTVAGVTYAASPAPGGTLTVTLQSALASGSKVRVVLRASGPDPIVGDDFTPLAGSVNGADPRDGQDHVEMFTV